MYTAASCNYNNGPNNGSIKNNSNNNENYNSTANNQSEVKLNSPSSTSSSSTSSIQNHNQHIKSPSNVTPATWALTSSSPISSPQSFFQSSSTSSSTNSINSNGRITPTQQLQALSSSAFSTTSFGDARLSYMQPNTLSEQNHPASLNFSQIASVRNSFCFKDSN